MAWDRRKIKILQLMEQGFSSAQIGLKLGLTDVTVRSNYQRMYNELGLPKYRRSPVSILRMAYALGWLQCPCPHCPTKESE